MSGVSVVNTSQLLQHKYTYVSDLFFENFFAKPCICYRGKKSPPCTKPAAGVCSKSLPALGSGGSLHTGSKAGFLKKTPNPK